MLLMVVASIWAPRQEMAGSTLESTHADPEPPSQ